MNDLSSKKLARCHVRQRTEVEIKIEFCFFLEISTNTLCHQSAWSVMVQTPIWRRISSRHAEQQDMGACKYGTKDMGNNVTLPRRERLYKQKGTTLSLCTSRLKFSETLVLTAVSL